jgi:phosphatidylglycerophosphatase A
MKRDPRHEARLLLSHPYGWIATGLGSGLAPIASGTVGSAAVLLLFALLGAHAWPPWLHLAIVGALFLIGVLASDWVCRRLGIDDAAPIVIDEWVGQWMTLAVAAWWWPSQTGWALAVMYALAFAFFRIADIVKPWPARHIDRELGGGVGAMLDDAIAGVYSSLAMLAVAWAVWR